jgi:hypothetical protein
MAKCPLCDGIVPNPERHPQEAGATIHNCKTCGRFAISGLVEAGLAYWPPRELGRRYHLSALTKNAKSVVMINPETVQRLSDGLFVDPPIPQKIEAIVHWVAKQSKEIGQRVAIQPGHAYPIATCPTAKEWRFLFYEVIKMGYLSGSTDEAWVTMQGWQRLTERPNATSSRAFIAMSFAESLKPVKEAIFRAIHAAGYEPIRVDDQEYVGGVMDKIIAFIRESRFVVADFTGNRGGVYYEAGFASGIGITVVPVCKHEQLASSDLDVRPHFDVNHLNFLPWKDGELPDFSTRLTDRILAVMGRGPVAESEN